MMGVLLMIAVALSIVYLAKNYIVLLWASLVFLGAVVLAMIVATLHI